MRERPRTTRLERLGRCHDEQPRARCVQSSRRTLAVLVEQLQDLLVGELIDNIECRDKPVRMVFFTRSLADRRVYPDNCWRLEKLIESQLAANLRRQPREQLYREK